MKITTITYRRVANLGNYQSATLEKTVQIQDGEDEEEATRLLMDNVSEQLRDYHFPKLKDDDDLPPY